MKCNSGKSNTTSNTTEKKKNQRKLNPVIFWEYIFLYVITKQILIHHGIAELVMSGTQNMNNMFLGGWYFLCMSI